MVFCVTVIKTCDPLGRGFFVEKGAFATPGLIYDPTKKLTVKLLHRDDSDGVMDAGLDCACDCEIFPTNRGAGHPFFVRRVKTRLSFLPTPSFR